MRPQDEGRIRAAVEADFSSDHDYTVGEVAQDRRLLLAEVDRLRAYIVSPLLLPVVVVKPAPWYRHLWGWLR